MKIKFCGGVQAVTGSCHLLTIGTKKVLLDCGQFQGGKALDQLNYEDFGFRPSEIDYLILSHAHVDHCGRIPLLVKLGFQGRIFCTDATFDLVQVMLRDSAYIQEKEAEWKSRKNTRAGKKPVEPLYTIQDAEASFSFFEPILYEENKEICDELRIRFRDAGHILGSAITEIWATEEGQTRKIVFSGDLGMRNRPILRDPEYIQEADYVIMETTYGNRVHPANSQSVDELIQIILKTTGRGGNVVIPSFAVGRTQEIIYQLNRFYEDNSPDYQAALDKIKVYVDSPMATTATEVFRRNAQVFDDETKEYILRGDHPLDFKNLIFTRSTEESRALNFNAEPKVILSASGMCEAGRIKHHLKHNLWNARNSIVFVGYQAEGTLGKRIKDGEKHVQIFGENIYVNAEIDSLEGMSGHADREALLDWLSGFLSQPQKIFLVHGEPDSKADFAAYVKEKLGYDCITVDEVAEFDLSSDPAPQKLFQGQLPQGGKDRISPDEAIQLREKISDLHDDFEQLLYNATLAVDGTRISHKKADAIHTTLLNLEKAIVTLGAEVSEEDRSEETAAVPPASQEESAGQEK